MNPRLRIGIALGLLLFLHVRNGGITNVVSVAPAPLVCVMFEDATPAGRSQLTAGQRDVLQATDEGSVRVYLASHARKDETGAPLVRVLDKTNTNVGNDHPLIQEAAKAGFSSVPFLQVSNGVQGEGFMIVDREQSLRILKKYGGP